MPSGFQSNVLQSNVMACGVEGQLLLRPFAAIPARMATAEAKFQSHIRNADDLRRSTQMAAAQGGDRAAYEALLRDCVPLIRVFAARQGVPPDHVDDVVQDVLLTIHRARQTYDPARPFTGWLRTIAERRAVDLLRRAGRQRAREVHSPLAFESYAEEPRDADYRADNTVGTKRVKDALAALPARQREAVQMLILEDRSLADVAVATRRSKGALKVNLHRALKALRARFAGTGRGRDDI
jgi:RNA polymerase sigma-70 factor (ECF subfamily)